jgi:uncharacterized circularly permuted ATP-grasp superfamily protein
MTLGSVLAPPKAEPVNQFGPAVNEMSLVGDVGTTLTSVLENLGPSGLAERAEARDAYLDRQGITFTLSGRERPLPLDLVPRVIEAEEWRQVEAGVVQRIRALEAFLADVYGPAEVLADHVVPRRLVTSSPHFHREAHGITSPNGVRIHVAGIDVVRDAAGKFVVLEDNVRCPSGVSYVLENRRTLALVLPELFAGQRLRSVADYPERLLDALAASAPPGVSSPVVVVLTPGVHNSAHYEHAFLARRMGVELVEGRDLFCSDDRVWMRTTQGRRPVDVIYRRIDDDFLDPVHFGHDSVLGVPGVLGVARAGRVTLANAVGNGVADDKAVYRYVPDFIRYYLDEEPLLDNVDTYDLQDADQLSHVLANIDRMVLKPTDGSGGYGILVGPSASDADLHKAAAAITADPRSWIAQPVVNLSTSPTVLDDGSIAQRHVDLRPFAVNDGEKVWVLPGGLTRVALPAGSLVVNSSQGGGSKDTWVLDDGVGPAMPRPTRSRPPVAVARRTAPLRHEAPETAPARVHQQASQQQQAQQPNSQQPQGSEPSC